MQIFKNKTALVITILGLLLGISLGKIYQQNLEIQALQNPHCPHPHFDHLDQIHIEIPNLDFELSEIVRPELEAHEADLEHATELMQEEMARLQEEYEKMLLEHDALIEQHVQRAKQRRAE